MTLIFEVMCKVLKHYTDVNLEVSGPDPKGFDAVICPVEISSGAH